MLYIIYCLSTATPNRSRLLIPMPLLLLPRLTIIPLHRNCHVSVLSLVHTWDPPRSQYTTQSESQRNKVAQMCALEVSLLVAQTRCRSDGRRNAWDRGVPSCGVGARGGDETRDGAAGQVEWCEITPDSGGEGCGVFVVCNVAGYQVSVRFTCGLHARFLPEDCGCNGSSEETRCSC